MEIHYLGWSAFEISGSTAAVIVDPFDPGMVGLPWEKREADLVCVTHDHADHNYLEGVKGVSFVIDSPGEYETCGVRVYGILTYHDDKKGEERGVNVVYRVEVDGLAVAHLGDLGHKLTDNQVEELGEVDVLILPVGGEYTIDYEVAAEIVAQIQPGVVVPCHYYQEGLKIENIGKVDKFLEEMGEERDERKKLRFTSQAQVPEETEVVVLKASK